MSTPYIPIPPLRPQTGPQSRQRGSAALIQFQSTGIPQVDAVLQDAQQQIANLVDQIQSLIDLTNKAIQVPVVLGGDNHQPGVVPDPGPTNNGYLDGNGNFSGWVLSGTNLYYNGGKVGLGTSSPPNELSILGDAGNFATLPNTTISINDTDAANGGAVGGRLLRIWNRRNAPIISQNLSSTDGTNWNLDVTAVNGTLIQLNAGNFLVNAATAGANPRTLPTPTFYADAINGLVGIKTTTPTGILHVIGSPSTKVGIGVENSSTSTGLTTDYASLLLTNTNSTVNNYTAIDFSDGTIAGDNICVRLAGITTNHASRTGDLAILTANAGTVTEKVRVTGAGAVGIGTAAPTAPLQVVGLVTYASDAAAGTGGLTAGAFYKDAAGGVHVKL